MNCNIQKKKGKILGQFTLNAYSDEPELPDISPDDAGKFLGVDENGEIVAEEIPSFTPTKYLHNINISQNYVFIENEDPTPFTTQTLAAYLYANYQSGYSNCVGTRTSIGTSGTFKHWDVGRLDHVFSPDGGNVTLHYKIQRISINSGDNTINSISDNKTFELNLTVTSDLVSISQ